jgi:hypothetical protein
MNIFSYFYLIVIFIMNIMNIKTILYNVPNAKVEQKR